MAINYIDFELVEQLSNYDDSVPMYNKVIKLSEETGELSQAFLHLANSANVSRSALNGNDPKLNVLEEACDVINVAMDIINKLEFEDDVVKEMFNTKLLKWASKHTTKQTAAHKLVHLSDFAKEHNLSNTAVSDTIEREKLLSEMINGLWYFDPQGLSAEEFKETK